MGQFPALIGTVVRNAVCASPAAIFKRFDDRANLAVMLLVEGFIDKATCHHRKVRPSERQGGFFLI